MLADVRGERVQRGGRQDKAHRSVRALILLPSERIHHPGEDPVGPPAMPVVVEAPHHEAVRLDEVPLRDVDRILLALEAFGSVEMIEECRLVRDDQILVGRGGTLQHIERRHHRDRDTRNRRVGIAGLERVNGVALPRDADMLLNPRNDVFRSRR